jgi:DHA2 family multidrug resistance protein-like MFS transporter
MLLRGHDPGNRARAGGTGTESHVMTTRTGSEYRGNDRLLFGMIFGVLAFWLFAQTTLNIAPTMAADLDVATDAMNIAVSIAALFSGIFVVVAGGLADRLGRVKIVISS